MSPELIPPRAELNRLHAELCTALADPIRIAILYALSDEPHNVSYIQKQLELPQSTISRHLRILRSSYLVKDERHGREVIYNLNDHRIIDALNLLREILGERIITHAQTYSSEL
jgi:ArsR family transcriptional regulator